MVIWLGKRESFTLNLNPWKFVGHVTSFDHVIKGYLTLWLGVPHPRNHCTKSDYLKFCERRYNNFILSRDIIRSYDQRKMWLGKWEAFPQASTLPSLVLVGPVEMKMKRL